MVVGGAAIFPVVLVVAKLCRMLINVLTNPEALDLCRKTGYISVIVNLRVTGGGPIGAEPAIASWTAASGNFLMLAEQEKRYNRGF